MILQQDLRQTHHCKEDAAIEAAGYESARVVQCRHTILALGPHLLASLCDRDAIDLRLLGWSSSSFASTIASFTIVVVLAANDCDNEVAAIVVHPLSNLSDVSQWRVTVALTPTSPKTKP